MTVAERTPLQDMAYVLCRHGLRICLVTALTVAAAAAYNATHKPLYTASMRVVASDGDLAGAAQDRRAVRNQMAFLHDPGLLGRLLSDPNPAAPAAAGGRSDARLMQALRVRAAADTDVIVLEFTWDDPVFAAARLNRIVAAYQRSMLASGVARDGLQRAQARLDDAQAELTAVDLRRAAATPAGDADELQGERARVETKLAARRAIADGVRLERALAQRTLEGLEAAFKAGAWVDGAEAGNAAGAPLLAAGFAALLDKRQALLASGAADSAAMRAIDREIARTRTQSYESARQVSVSRVAALDDRLEQLRTSEADDEAGLLALDRHVSEAEVFRDSRLAKVARVAEERRRLDAAGAHADGTWQASGAVRVLSDATPPAQADWPGPPVILGAAGAGGLVLGLVGAGWAERRRRTIDRPADLFRGLGIEVLARLEDFPVALLQ